jgi:hydroxymethylglutaryl-CoA reductase (NADPH)
MKRNAPPVRRSKLGSARSDASRPARADSKRPARRKKALVKGALAKPARVKLPALPRAPDDDHALVPVEQRRALWRRASGTDTPHVVGEPVPLASARGKIEGLVGYAQIPLGLAGPLSVDTSLGARELYVPLATTEGALVASYSRGMRLLAAGGGARSRVVHEGLTQAPILEYADARAAIAAAALANASLKPLQHIVRGISAHGRLVGLDARTIGRRIVVELVFTTGDAIGINMAARAADLCSAWLAERTDARRRFVHGQDVEKRANARALVHGRGRSVVCDVTVPRAALVSLTRAQPEDLVAIHRAYAVGFARLGTQNWLVQSANGLAAAFLALGQDAAYVTESATGFLDLDLDARGDLYASATLPSLLVGTVGGGTGQGTAAECLAALGCAGAGKANHLAEILGAVVLAGDLSLMAAFCAHEFVAAHEKLGRNRPAARPPRR